ncbi:hypothetical protein ZWY2020_040842 [Hordeum vulgare]|nr:hypothetical protein ZWY2020_040842 [Hordeum vulgare]
MPHPRRLRSLASQRSCRSWRRSKRRNDPRASKLLWPIRDSMTVRGWVSPSELVDAVDTVDEPSYNAFVRESTGASEGPLAFLDDISDNDVGAGDSGEVEVIYLGSNDEDIV